MKFKDQYRLEINDIVLYAQETRDFAKNSRAIESLRVLNGNTEIPNDELQRKMLGLILELVEAQDALEKAIFSNIELEEDIHGNKMAMLDVKLVATEIDEVKAVQC